ncbi:MAG: molybdopterin converting factor subunit 1 [Sedimenticola sp.]|nr:molybdopterin converting factor subunit 1 [Sedimenticola sp.]
MINLLYFARLREELDCADEALEYTPELGTVADLVAVLRARGGSWSEVFDEGETVMVAVNQEMGGIDSPLADGDEVAFFPPVTGG